MARKSKGLARAAKKPKPISEQYNQTELVPVADLIPYANNARTHSDDQVAVIAKSIERFGWTNPVLIGKGSELLAGHGRLMAAKRLGIAKVPAIRIGHLSPDEQRAYILADNQTALRAGWDLDILRGELAALDDAGFDLGVIGFDPQELAGIRDVRPTGLTDPDEAPEPPQNPVATRGDLWALGRHRLLCGDALDIAQVERLMGGIVPDIANCDPPYGISIVSSSATDGGAKPFGKVGGGKPHPFKGAKGHVHGLAPLGPAVRGREHGPARKAIIQPGVYAQIIGDDSTETAIRGYEVLSELGVPVMALWGGNYYADALPASRCWLVWDKENTGSFADAELAWTNQDAVVRVLRHQWSGLIKASERGERRVHPTQKPVALAEWVIETLAPEAKTAIDLFVGSGSTLIACECKGLDWYGVEMAEAYIDVIIARWQKFTGLQAKLDGKTFAQVKAERHKQAA